MTNRELGNLGEKIAQNYLIKKGYQIMATNYYGRHGEIDIIAKEKTSAELVFLEVKTRTNRQYGYPEDAVNALKKYHLVHTAEKFLWQKHYPGHQNYRFDTIAIEINFNSKQAKIKHLKCI
ncbi:MAG TPA: YraN family protein [bacterium]|nr:YraN family protein [bacterium]